MTGVAKLPRTAFVTGGGDGIGRALCVTLALRGVSVTVVDINATAAEQTVRSCGGSANALAVTCDVTDDAALQRAFGKHIERWRTLGLCVCNAGVAEGTDWRAAVAINVVSALATAKLALSTMRSAGGGGVVVFVASMGGILPMADQPVYSATKAAVLHFTRSMGEVLELDGEADRFSVCAVAPAIVRTGLAAEQARVAQPARRALLERLLDEKGGVLMPDTVAHAVARLAATPGRNGSILRIFQNGTLRFLAPAASARYPWTPAPPASLAELPPPVAARL
jgi:NAD(P)-dependent dehydrogenase (short-subunit alcohol dehydrogenase family)